MRSRWALHRGHGRGVAGEGQRDPVADVEAGVLARLLHGTHDIARQALGLQLGRHRRVEHHEAAAGQERDRARRVGRLELELVLAVLEQRVADEDRLAVVEQVDAPVAGLRRLDDALHVLAHPRSEGARVDAEPAGDAVVGEAGLLQIRQLDRLHVELVAKDVGELGERRRVGSHDGEPRQREAHAQIAGLAQRQARRRDLAHGIHRLHESRIAREPAVSGQSSRCTLRPPVSPRQISSATSGMSGAAIRAPSRGP